jgi:hypothetical protein
MDRANDPAATGAAGEPPRSPHDPLQAVEAWIEKRDRLAAACILLITAVFSFIQALRQPMWLDELYTYYIATQPTAAESLKALLEGCDGAPPLYALMGRPLMAALPDPVFALRIPSILGGLLAIASAFFLLRRRLPKAWALSGCLAMAVAVSGWIAEARCYGLVVGCSGAALACWLWAIEGKRRPLALAGLFLSLALSVALQYYTVFLLAAVGCGELARSWRRRRVDFAVWAAICCPAFVLIPHAPFIRALTRFLPYYWSKSTWAAIPMTYFTLLVWPAAAMLVALVAARLLSGQRAEEQRMPEPQPVHEAVCFGAVALLPAIQISAAMFTTHVFVYRYGSMALVGLVVMIIEGAFRAAKGSRRYACCLALAFSQFFLMMYALPAFQKPRMRTAEPARELLRDAPAEPRMVLFSDHLIFMELWFYGTPAERARMAYPLSPATERRWMSMDTTPLMLEALRKRITVNAPDYETVLATTPRFLVCAQPTTWLPIDLKVKGYRLTRISKEAASPTIPVLYLAERGGSAQ